MPRYNFPSKSQIEQRARAIQRDLESRVKSKTNNGRRPLSKYEIEQLAKEAARRLKF